MKRISWATAISIGAHAALMSAVAYAPGRWFEDGTSVDPITFEIIVPEDVDAEEPRPVVEDEALAPPSPAEPQQVAASSVVRPSSLPFEPSPLDPPDEAEVAASTVEVPSLSPESAPDRPTAEQLRMILPFNAARDSYIIDGPGPSPPGAPAGLQPIGPPPMTEEEIERLHNRHLRSVATARPWLTRSEPELHRQADGSQRYDGTGIVATIRPDGTVHFDRRDNVQGDGINAGGTFDITGAVMGAAGQDPTAGEQEWFMRHTEELRQRLEAAHRRATMSAGLARVRGRLRVAWNRSGRATSRRRALFDIWDDMSEDESGAEGRRIVIAFIRVELPAGSEDAFSEREIARLNASRESTEPFAPY